MFIAEKLKDYDKKHFTPGYASIKRNGIHGIYTRQDKIFSRTPRQLDGLEHLFEPLNRSPYPLMFEIVVPGIPFQAASGLIKNMQPTPEAHAHIFNIAIPRMPFSERLKVLQKFDTQVAKYYDQIHVEEMTWVEDLKSFDLFYDQAVEAGEEGACWISPYHFYSPGMRQWNWMKRVPLKSIEATIIKVLPGTKGKKYQDSLGSFVFEMDNGKVGKVGIFKGTNDLWREKMWLEKEKQIGRRITIEFKNYSEDGIPVQPRFKDFRWDL